MDNRNLCLICSDQPPEETSALSRIPDGVEALYLSAAEDEKVILGAVSDRVALIVLEFTAPSDRGLKLLAALKKSRKGSMIPAVVLASPESGLAENECLRRGAWDFIGLPDNRKCTALRLQNEFDHSPLPYLDRALHAGDYDACGIYSKTKFFEASAEVMQQNPDRRFALLRFDIENFRMINLFFGTAEGDRLIARIARLLQGYGAEEPLMTYGHIEADVFCLCAPFDRERLIALTEKIRGDLRGYPIAFRLQPFFGITFARTPDADIAALFDEAGLAERSCKGNYLINYAFFEQSMIDRTANEQRIINDMEKAIEQKQFVVWLQPQYDLRTGAVSGAEALVRWKHPKRGLISPGEFIPVFERNGFISRLDSYVWRETCALLRKWIDSGKPACPVSVNISRVDFSDPMLAEKLISLVREYDLPTSLMEFEVTESAYTASPEAIRSVVHKLRGSGFKVLMDDFGSGYSSLNVLKDIAMDVLKIDMKFLQHSDTPGRSENILDSVVRMAKWLNMTVLAEGVETSEQVEFLRNIGCEYVQGYFFARPMPAADFEKLLSAASSLEPKSQPVQAAVSADSLWSTTSQLEKLFTGLQQAMAMCEFDGREVAILRVNDTYSRIYGYGELADMNRSLLSSVALGDRSTVRQAFEDAVECGGTSQCEYRRMSKEGDMLWVRMSLRYTNSIGSQAVLFAGFIDITAQKEMESELAKMREVVRGPSSRRSTLLIVDDEEVNRVILRSIFSDRSEIIEAANGTEGLRVLRAKAHEIDLVLLDLTMPGMNGEEFLHAKKADPLIAGVPVVITTADDSTGMQTTTLELGASDYIVKPYVPAVVKRRVANVLEASFRFAALSHSGDISAEPDPEKSKKKE